MQFELLKTDGAARRGMLTLTHGVEFETLCEHYWRACQLGTPSILSATEMAEVIALFKTYGKPRPVAASGSASTPEAA